MSPAKPVFSLADVGEVFFTSTATSAAIRRLVAEEKVRRIAPRLYTKNVTDPIGDVVRRRPWDVAAGYFPGAVIADRTAFEMRPAGEEGSIFLSGPGSDRTVSLPGLRIVHRRGPGSAEGDSEFLGGRLYLSSWPRRFLDNVRPSRARKGVSRTLRREELEDRLRQVLDTQGWEGLNAIRDGAEALALELDARAEVGVLHDLIGALLGTVDAPLVTRGARAASLGRGWDDTRLPRFDRLTEALAARIPHARPERAAHAGQVFAFYESYFSNFIEGTEFTLAEAEEIVFEGRIPAQRPADGHDVLGTFDLVVDGDARRRVPRDADDLQAILRSFHQRIMVGRPEAGPGVFKTRANRAGSTEFVDPTLVVGTLEEGWLRYSSLPEGFPRAVFAMFLVAEVHPFADGNGRVARALANAELTAAGQQRIVVPTVARDDYLHALRALTRTENPRPFVRVADRVQQWSAEVDWTTLASARGDLERTHALLSSAEADAEGVILRLPSEM